MNKKEQKTIYFSIFFVMILLIVLVGYNFIIRCPQKGLDEAKAINIASKYMPIHFEGTFKLVHHSFDDSENEWSFSYSQDGGSCKVDCLVDRCGVFDVVGVTGECKSFP